MADPPDPPIPCGVHTGHGNARRAFSCIPPRKAPLLFRGTAAGPSRLCAGGFPFPGPFQGPPLAESGSSCESGPKRQKPDRIAAVRPETLVYEGGAQPPFFGFVPHPPLCSPPARKAARRFWDTPGWAPQPKRVAAPILTIRPQTKSQDALFLFGGRRAHSAHSVGYPGADGMHGIRSPFADVVHQVGGPGRAGIIA